MRTAPTIQPQPKDTSWTQIEPSSIPVWKEVYGQLAGRIASEAPDALPRFSTWFATMPVLGLFERGSQVCIQYYCSNQHRKQEVEKLHPMLECLLAELAFPEREVVIELVTDPAPTQTGSGSSEPTAVEAAQPAAIPLDEYRRKINVEISDQDLQAVIQAVEKTVGVSPGATARPAALEDSGQDLFDSLDNLERVIVAPEYATSYDSIVRGHSAIYLPAYFVRHLRHMGASDGLRYLALRQIAYKQGLKDVSGPHLLPATQKELTRWSTLSERNFPGNLADPASYLHLLAGRVPFYEYYQSLPAGVRWEDSGGYRWKTKDREFCVWKTDGGPGDTCSQLISNPATNEQQWRKAAAIYRVQLSMPLCPEDADTLRGVLESFGVQHDPLGAIRQCLALARDEVIPDRPLHLLTLPERLLTIQELVLEAWGGKDRSLTAEIAAQSKLLENHLIQPDRQLLKIPLYLLEKWGQRLSPAQLWTTIILMDRVYADSANGQYRDTTTVRHGIKEMMLWTDDEYSKGASRKVTKWLHPFHALFGKETDEAAPSQAFNPWFSVFASELLTANGARTKNQDNSVTLNLRVLPLVPLTPEDTLLFAYKMNCTRMLARDAGGQLIGLEIMPEELVVYLPSGGTLRYSYSGELRYGEKSLVTLQAADRNLAGIEILSSALFYELENWSGALFGVLENNPGALLCGLKKPSGALLCELSLEPGALFCVLLKLLILNLYGIKNSSSLDEPPSIDNLTNNIDSLEQFGSHSGQFIQWTEERSDSDWDFQRLVKALGITDVQRLQAVRVSPAAIVAGTLEVYTTPSEKFTTGRISVLVAKLRRDPDAGGPAYKRLAELGPEHLQHCLRRAILGIDRRAGDPDWDSVMARTRRDDLIELAEKLALARVIRSQN